MAFIPRRCAPPILLLLFCLRLPGQPLMNLPTGVIAVDASPAPVVYATVGAGLFRSTDAGFNWTAVHIRPAGQRQPVLTQILADPVAPGTLYAATDLDDGGVWKTTNGGATWTAVNTGLPAAGAVVEHLIQLRSNPLILYAKVGNEIYKTVNGGDIWSFRGTLPGAGIAFAVAPSEPNVMFFGQGSAVYRSLDEGATWALPFSLPAAAGSGVATLAVDVLNSMMVYAGVRGLGSGNGVYRSTDQGSTYNRLIGTQPRYLYVDPRGRSIVYASPLENICIEKTLTRGLEWRQICLGSGIGGIRLAFDPRNANTLWAATGAGVYTSADAGESWLSRFGSVRPTLVSPAFPYEFRLSGGLGRLDLPVRLQETDRWAVPVTVATSGEPWLSVSGVTGTTPATAIVRVNADGLAAGNYSATVRISSTQASNSPVEVAVRLVAPAQADAAPPYTISTYAGTGQRGTFGDGNPATLAAFDSPDSLAVEPDGTLYVSDSGSNRVRRIDTRGIITRFAGIGQFNFGGDGGEALLASFRGPTGLALDAGRRLFIADTFNNRVRVVSADGFISTLRDGLESPRGVAVDGSGNVYVALPSLHIVARIAPGGQVTRFAGIGLPGFRADGGFANLSRLSAPTGVAAGPGGNVYIADTENNRVRVVTQDGRIRTIAGNGLAGFQGDGESATATAVARPTGLTVDNEGNLFIADTENQRVRMVTPAGAIRTVAGTGVAGFSGDGGPAARAQLRGPSSVAADALGNLYISDSLNLRIRKLAPPAPPVVPQVSEGGVVNAADGSPRLAPGGLFSIFGAGFGSGVHQASAAPWPATLGGIAVSISGRSAPLFFVNPGQINGQAPFEIQPGPAAVQVSLNGVAGREVTARVLSAAPGILQFGAARAVAQNPDGSVNTAETPIEAGSVIVVYLTGQGLLDNPVPTGAPAPLDPLSRPTLPVSAKIGDQEAQVLFLGLAPGFVGLAQANLLVPDLPPGDYPVTITIGGETSNAATISVGGGG